MQEEGWKGAPQEDYVFYVIAYLSCGVCLCLALVESSEEDVRKSRSSRRRRSVRAPQLVKALIDTREHARRSATSCNAIPASVTKTLPL